MKWYYILFLLGTIGCISCEEHNRVRRQNAVLPKCPPADCPQDCGIQFFTDQQTGCQRCRCDPNDSSNPFEFEIRCPPKPCPDDCSDEQTVNDETGCPECKCQDDLRKPPQECKARSRCTNNGGVCKKTCDTNEDQLKDRRACKGRRCKCCIKRPSCNPNPPCPADCATTFITDTETGCRICSCRPSTGVSVGTCTPGETWTDKCNSCFCPPSGVPACTTKACTNAGLCNPNPPCPADCATEFVTNSKGCQSCRCRPSTGKPNPLSVGTCTPGETWTDKCNSCFCSPAGVSACTERACTNVCSPVPCPGGCAIETDATTGCPKCNCQPLVKPPPDRCPQNPRCPADCATEFVPNPQNGCISCRCRTDITQINPFAPPLTTLACPPINCPADCSTTFIPNQQTGCITCQCSTDTAQINPFAPPPTINACPSMNCPADCTTAFIRNQQTGCITCQCNIDTTQINPFAPPLTINACPPRDCPADCTTEFISNQQTGCISCYCRTDIIQINPFAPPPTINACPPSDCPADCTTEFIRNQQTGCTTCRCRTDITQTNPF